MASVETTWTDSLVTNHFGDRYLYEVNRNTFDQFGAQNVFQQQFQSSFSEADKLHIIIGTDSGLLPEFVHRYGNPSNRYIFVELEQINNALNYGNVSNPIATNISITDRKKFWADAKSHLIDSYIYQESLLFWESFGARNDFIGQYHELAATIQREIKSRAYELSASLGSRSFLECQIDNMADNRYPAKIVENLFPGKTAVILGGGPSLDEFIPWVKQNRDHLIIFAVSRICRRLIEVDLAPHFVVSVDSSDYSFAISREMLLLADKAIFFHSFHVAPRLLALWEGRSLYLGQRIPWTSSLNKENLPIWGPTVTNTALGIAVAMGVKQAVLIGVDMCYSPAGYTHAAGNVEHIAGPKLDAQITVITNSGHTAETGPEYFSAIHQLSAQAKIAKRQGCAVISPAPNAAQIEHVTFKPIEKLAPEPLSIAPTDILFAALPADSPANRKADGQQLLEELYRGQHDLEQIAGTVENALKTYHSRTTEKEALPALLRRLENDISTAFPELSAMFNRYGTQDFLDNSADSPTSRQADVQRLLDELSKLQQGLTQTADTIENALASCHSKTAAKADLCLLERDLSAAFPDLVAVLKQYGARDFLKIQDQSPADIQFKDEQPEEYFRTLQKHLGDILRRILAATQRTICRIEEDKSSPDFDLISQQWHYDKQLGRIRVWLARRPEILDIAPENFQDVFSKRKQQIDTWINERLLASPRQSERLVRYHLDGVFGKALKLFLAKDTLQLQKILTGLTAYPNDSTAQELSALIQGYIFELEQKNDCALTAYQQLIGDTFNQTVEEALRRVSVICLSEKNLEMATLALECLSNASATYQPKYADLLCLVNRRQEAADVYTEYLQNNPSDLITLIKLGQNYEKMGAKDVANQVYQLVLEQDPGNPVALKHIQK